MAVAEIDALTGFRFDNEETNKLTTIRDLQRVELENDDTKANIYFNAVRSFFAPSIDGDNILSISDRFDARLLVHVQRHGVPGS